MPKKPTKKRINWKDAAIALGRCAVFTLSHAGTKSGLKAGSGMRFYTDENGKHHVEEWEKQFFDALDSIGHVIDRKHYASEVAKKQSKGRRK